MYLIYWIKKENKRIVGERLCIEINRSLFELCLAMKLCLCRF